MTGREEHLRSDPAPVSGLFTRVNWPGIRVLVGGWFGEGGSSTSLQLEDGCCATKAKRESPPEKKRSARAQIRRQLRLSHADR